MTRFIFITGGVVSSLGKGLTTTAALGALLQARGYKVVLDEKNYLGKTIQVIPHVTDEIKKFIEIGKEEVDFMLCEILLEI